MVLKTKGEVNLPPWQELNSKEILLCLKTRLQVCKTAANRQREPRPPRFENQRPSAAADACSIYGAQQQRRASDAPTLPVQSGSARQGSLPAPVRTVRSIALTFRSHLAELAPISFNERFQAVYSARQHRAYSRSSSSNSQTVVRRPAWRGAGAHAVRTRLSW